MNTVQSQHHHLTVRNTVFVQTSYYSMSASETCTASGYEEIEWNGHLAIELSKRLSFKQCIEYLMDGYIKKHATKLQHSIYPFAVQQMSIKYLNGEKFFVRFKSSFSNKKELELMHEHYAKVTNKLTTHSVYYINTTLFIDLPIPVQDNKIKLEWRVKINGLSIPNGHYFIGIVSDRYKYFDTTVWMKANQKNIIYGVFGNSLLDADDGTLTNTIIWNGDSAFFGQSPKSHSHRFKIGESNFKSDDIVTVQYDGALKQLKIIRQKNNQLICEFYLKTPSNRIKYYYPAISLKDLNDYVQIV